MHEQVVLLAALSAVLMAEKWANESAAHWAEKTVAAKVDQWENTVAAWKAEPREFE